LQLSDAPPAAVVQVLKVLQRQPQRASPSCNMLHRYLRMSPFN
jgi:hypothetical protein